MKLTCPDCGKQYDSGKFCPECGGKLQEIVPELVCPSCGYKAKSAKFCPECGAKLTEQFVGESKAISERKFNEKDPRFAKYYDKKGSPRTIPQEERDVAIEELTPFVEQNVAEAKMLLGNILLYDTNKDTILQGVQYINEAERTGDKLAYYIMGFAYYHGLGVEEDCEEAEKRMLEWHQEFADGTSAGILAELYTYSESKCDYKKAFEFASIAAEEEDADGYVILGDLFLNGWGVRQNTQTALENYKMAAALGNEVAMNQIGSIFKGNNDFDADHEQAFYWFNEAAQKGYGTGMYNVANCYVNGIGVNVDMEKAAEWYKKAAEAGHADAMFQLGFYYQQVLVDKRKSEKWYRKAAESGSTDAMIELGVWGDFKDDDNKAFEWFQKAADKGNVAALRHLAGCYLNGRGVPVNLQKACEILNEAVESGDDSAVYELVKVFENGYGTNQDKEKAFALYLDAAEEGDATAMRCLGICHINGFGTEVNLSEGRKWLTRADEEGDYVAADILENLEDESVIDEISIDSLKVETKSAEQDYINEPNKIVHSTQVVEQKTNIPTQNNYSESCNWEKEDSSNPWKWVAIALIAVLLIGGGFYLMRQNSSTEETNSSQVISDAADANYAEVQEYEEEEYEPEGDADVEDQEYTTQDAPSMLASKQADATSMNNGEWWVGTIGGNSGIRMYINEETDEFWYHYTKYSSDNRMYLSVVENDEDHLVLLETNKNGLDTGKFDGYMNGNTYSGTFYNLLNGKTFGFSLNRQ